MPTHGVRFGEGVQIKPILAPQDIVATATATSYVDLKNVNWATFLVQFGAIASTDTTGGATVTVEASTAASSNATEGAIAFDYRLSGAVNTDTMGAKASATSAGADIVEANDNKILIIEVDPSVVAASGADRRFVRVVVTPTAETTSTIYGVTAILEHRYPGNAIPSST